jgi:hypothetical protein
MLNRLLAHQQFQAVLLQAPFDLQTQQVPQGKQAYAKLTLQQRTQRPWP